MDVVTLLVLCDNFNKEIETLTKSENNFDVVAIAAVCCCFVRRNLNRVQNYSFLSLQMQISFSTMQQEMKRKTATAANNVHWQTLTMVGNILGASPRQEQNCTNGTGISV